MKKLVDYILDRDIHVEIHAGPNVETDVHDGHRWEHHAYELVLVNGALGTSMALPWKQGIGITEDPDERPEQVLDCMISDAWGYEQANGFESWAGEYGYDTNSRKAERLYRDVGTNARAFLAFIGGKAELEKLALKHERL